MLDLSDKGVMVAEEPTITILDSDDDNNSKCLVSLGWLLVLAADHFLVLLFALVLVAQSGGQRLQLLVPPALGMLSVVRRSNATSIATTDQLLMPHQVLALVAPNTPSLPMPWVESIPQPPGFSQRWRRRCQLLSMSVTVSTLFFFFFWSWFGCLLVVTRLLML